MPTNLFVDLYTNVREQSLMDNLIRESISMYGHDAFYLPRTVYNEDEILNEPEYVAFRDALQFTIYFKNFESFEGEGNLLSKFGLEIRDQVTLWTSITAFQDDVKDYINISRPREGDVIYLPMTAAAYQIKYVETVSQFYPLGKLYIYEIVAELLEFSNQIFETGVNEIDTKYEAYYNDATETLIMSEANAALTTESSRVIVLETYDETLGGTNYTDNPDFEDAGDDVLDFTERDPFSVDGEY